MNIKKVITHPLLNKTELAKRVYPTAKNAKTLLSRKLAGTEGRKLSKEDEEKIEKVMREFWKDLMID